MKTHYIFYFLIFLFPFTINAQTLDSTLPDSSVVKSNNDFDNSHSRTIITAAEIEERGYDNLDELLASVPGVFLNHDRTFTQIGIRGSSPTASNNQRVKVLLDDLPLNSPSSGQAPVGFDLSGINMEDIKEVIVIRNPSPVENGNNAMLGVIKINTKKPSNGGRVNFDTGSFGEYDGGFSIGHIFGKTSLGISGRLADIKGQELYIPTDTDLTKEAAQFGGLQLQAHHGKFSFHGFYHQRKESTFGLPGGSNLRFSSFNPPIDSSGTRGFQTRLDTAGLFQQKQLYANFQFSTPFKTNQHIDVQLFVNYENQNREQHFQDDVYEFVLDSVIGVDSFPWTQLNYFEQPKQKSLWLGLNYHHKVQISPNHQLLFGTDLLALPFSKIENKLNPTYYEFIPDVESTTTDFPDEALVYLNFFSDSIFLEKKFFDFWSTDFFVQDKVRFNNKFAVSGGVRVNINSQTKPVLAPSLNFIFSPFEDKTNFQIGYSQGFRLPSIIETNSAQKSTESFEPRKFTPEKSNNFELGWLQKIGKDFDLNLALYHQRLEDLVWNENNDLPTQPERTLARTGLEGGLGVNLKKGVKTYLNYNFQFDKKEEVNMPSPLCKFGVTIPFLKHFTIFAEGQYDGGRLTFDGTYTLPYFLMNTNLLIRPQLEEGNWLSNISFAFRLFNAFDEVYQHPSAQKYSTNLVPQNGRTWQTQLTYKF